MQTNFSERFKWMIGITVLLFALILSTCNSCHRISELTHQLDAKNDTNKMYRNKFNELVSEKQAFVGEKADLNNELESWKATGDTLESKITSQTQSMVYLKKQLTIAGTGKPVIIHDKDSVVIVGQITIDTPTYKIDTVNKFVDFKFAGNKSKYAYQVKVIDNTELATENLGSKGTLVRVINRNPYVTSSEAKSIIVAQKKQSGWQKWLGFAAGLAAGYLIFK